MGHEQRSAKTFDSYLAAWRVENRNQWPGTFKVSLSATNQTANERRRRKKCVKIFLNLPAFINTTRTKNWLKFHDIGIQSSPILKYIQLYFHSTPIARILSITVKSNRRKYHVKVYHNRRNFPMKVYPNPRIFRPKTTQNWLTSPSYPKVRAPPGNFPIIFEEIYSPDVWVSRFGCRLKYLMASRSYVCIYVCKISLM